MSGSLIKLDEQVISTAVSSITLGDTNWDNSYNVYIVQYSNVYLSTLNAQLRLGLLEGGTRNTTANYDVAQTYFRNDTSFADYFNTNDTSWGLGVANNNATTNVKNGIITLYGMNSSTEYVFTNVEQSSFGWSTSQVIISLIGGGVCTITGSARNGVDFFASSGNINIGKFQLYGLKN